MMLVMTEWQPIETAPKDGSAILSWPTGSMFKDDTFSYVVRWCGWRECWIEAAGEEYQGFEPTHWMPLPPPPKKGDE